MMEKIWKISILEVYLERKKKEGTLRRPEVTAEGAPRHL
jgi:hypothetical protein